MNRLAIPALPLLMMSYAIISYHVVSNYRFFFYRFFFYLTFVCPICAHTNFCVALPSPSLVIILRRVHGVEQISDDEDDGFGPPIEDYFPAEQEGDPATQDITDVMEAMAISLSSSQSIAARAAAEAALSGVRGAGAAAIAMPTPNSPIDLPAAGGMMQAANPKVELLAIPKVGSQDFDIMKVIGQGGYGKVSCNSLQWPASEE